MVGKAKPVNDDHLDDAVKRLRQDKTRLKETRDSFQKTAASFAPPRPWRPQGYTSSIRNSTWVPGVGSWRARAAAATSGCVGPPQAPADTGPQGQETMPRDVAQDCGTYGTRRSQYLVAPEG